MIYGRWNKYVVGIGAVIILASCSTTKRLGESDVLYTGVKKIEIESMTEEDVPSSVESAIKDPLNVKPNNPLYSPYIRTPLPIGLWVWNYFYTERTTGFRSWIYRRFGKQPVLISKVQPEARVELVQDVLDNHGYFGSTGGYELHYRRNPKKARISYHFEVAEPWFYSKVTFPERICNVTNTICDLQATSNLQPGAQYNVDSMSNERVRITNFLRNGSYYYFRPEYIEYLADTTQEPYKVDLRMVMAAGIPPAAMKAYDVGNMTVRIFNSTGGQADSVMHNDVMLWYQEPLKLKPKVLDRALTLKPGDPARLGEINKTITNLNKLEIFRYVNLEVTPLDSLNGRDSMDLTIVAALDNPLQAQFEVDFRSLSNSFMGPAAMFSVQHNNAFRGGEKFNFRVHGSYEWQTGNTSSQLNASTINSYEVGLNTSLAWPRVVPDFIPLAKKYGGRTTLNLGGSVLNRPNFFTMMAANFSAAYDWQTSAKSSHNWTVFKLVYNDLLRTTDAFEEAIGQNETIKRSFENQFIPSMSYTYTWDTRYGRNKRHRLVWQTNITEAGNIIAGAQGLFGREDKALFGSHFSQFAKLTTEIKTYYQINPSNIIAARFFAGAGYAYGNSEVLPYSEQFFIGGAYSIRAFTIRSIGPGSFRPALDNPYGYFDQTGDFKLELNLEYRMKLLGNLYGAVFFDAGNIWLLKKDEKRPGGTIGAGGFLNQIATGTGAGLRFDLNFLVLRADLGIALHTPYANPEKPGYYNIPSFKDGLGFHLAIGYPF